MDKEEIELGKFAGIVITINIIAAIVFFLITMIQDDLLISSVIIGVVSVIANLVLVSLFLKKYYIKEQKSAIMKKGMISLSLIVFGFAGVCAANCGSKTMGATIYMYHWPGIVLDNETMSQLRQTTKYPVEFMDDFYRSTYDYAKKNDNIDDDVLKKVFKQDGRAPSQKEVDALKEDIVAEEKNLDEKIAKLRINCIVTILSYLIPAYVSLFLAISIYDKKGKGLIVD